MEVSALRKQGWSVSAIARHVGVTRATVRGYLSGRRVPGQRARAAVDPFEEFAEYCRRRFRDDPHLWATTLFDEVRELGYAGSYPSFTRGLRARSLRPRCDACAAARGDGDRAIIDHPPGEETQFDWVELPDPPAAWGGGKQAHLLVGALSHSGRWRGVLADAEDQPHLIEALDAVVRRLGGLTRAWRFDRMSTVCHPDSGGLLASFAPVAVHYGVTVPICPPGHGWRKGVVEKANHGAAQRWWRTVADDATVRAAQAGLDRLTGRLDERPRTHDGVRTTVGALAAAEPLRAVPAPYPATIEVERTVRDQALIGFRGNCYSVPPGHAGELVVVRHRLGSGIVEVSTAGGVDLARHRREPDGAGALVRADEHVAALERAVLATFTDRRPCRHKTRRPPSPAALAEAERIRQASAAPCGQQVIVDFAAYAAGTRPLRPLDADADDPGADGPDADSGEAEAW